MKQNDNLQRTYGFIRSAFFPRWDKRRRWQVKEVWDLPSEGRCETEGKLIYIRPQKEMDRVTLHLLLIHEICHAIAPNHGNKWRQRMLKAADQAERIGMASLSESIRREAETYFQDKKTSASDIYQQIRQIVRESPNASFSCIVRYLAMENGLYRSEIVKKYTLCRKIYEKAIQNRQSLRSKQ